MFLPRIENSLLVHILNSKKVNEAYEKDAYEKKYKFF